jgi:hypothetical protein
MKNDKPQDAKPVRRDNGVLDPTCFASLPPLPKHVTSGAPVLLPQVVMPDGTIVRHRV